MNKRKILLTIIPIISALTLVFVLNSIIGAGTSQSSAAESIDTAGWSTYVNNELGFSFQYPKEYGQVINFAVNPGETGFSFGGRLSNTEVVFYGISPDYTVGKGGHFGITAGFSKKGTKYYFKTVGGQEFEIENPVRSIQAFNTGGIIITGTPDGGPGAFYNPGAGSMGAVFNLKSVRFPGIAFVNMGQNGISQEMFEALLSTFTVRPVKTSS